MKIEIPLCHKCDNKIIQPDMFDQEYTIIAGCKLISKQEWKKNNSKSCPLIKKTQKTLDI